MEDPKNSSPESSTDKEKIREFCYELAKALRRITGRTVEDTKLDLPEDLGSSQQTKPTDPQDNQ